MTPEEARAIILAGVKRTLVCVVCGQPGTPTVKALNGLPKGVVACEACREAVKRREVGVSVAPDGSLHVTDGRVKDEAE